MLVAQSWERLKCGKSTFLSESLLTSLFEGRFLHTSRRWVRSAMSHALSLQCANGEFASGEPFAWGSGFNTRELRI